MDLRTILLTTDLSETSKKAVAAALTLAKKFSAKLILFHVGDLFPPVVGAESYVAVDFAGLQKEMRDRAETQLARFAEQNLGRGIDVERRVTLGIPHLEIVELAHERKVDLIVMAPHGHGFISHLVLGSTTERVLRRAPCPVLVVRDDSSAG